MAIAQKALETTNNFLATVTSGAKGDYFNIAQITGLLGQQNLNGERIQPMLNNFSRTLPHYPVEKVHYNEDMSFESRGFIRSSFIHGLKPREYFFHAMTGREGITDTAMKTATSGYIQRRMIKIAEDVQVKYDGTVRNSANSIIQMAYGDNFLDPMHTVFVKNKPMPCNISRIMKKINHKHAASKKGLV
jgi:DNA-directed RNA polymerase II subunit RPB1